MSVFLGVLATIRPGHKPAFAGLPPGIIELAFAAQEFDCLRSIFNDPYTQQLLDDTVSYTSLWHIASRKDADGFVHSLHFAGRKRNTSRVSLVHIRVDPSELSQPQVEASIPSFGSLDLGEPPIAQTREDLSILRGAFNDAGVRGDLLRSISTSGEDIHYISIERSPTGGDRYLCFKGPKREDTQQFVVKWLVRFDPVRSRYVFYSD